jgi:hypothetical protein
VSGVGRIYRWSINYIEFAVLNFMEKALSLSKTRPDQTRPDQTRVVVCDRKTEGHKQRSAVFLAERLRNVMDSSAAWSLPPSLPHTEHIFVASLLFLAVL